MTAAVHRRLRPGFSLVELIVVVSLLAVLVALSAGAFFRIRNAQIKDGSIATVNKVNAALDARWATILEQTKNEIKQNSTPAAKAARADAGGDLDVAETLLLYAKTKNELPMTFAEAKSTTVIGNIYLQPRKHFEALGGGPGTPEESGICLFVALTSSGAGGTETGGGLDQQAIKATVNNVEYRTFGDSWGVPLAFVRHCYAGEVQASPYVKDVACDPFDQTLKPDKTRAHKAQALLAAKWGSQSTPQTILFDVPTFAGMPSTYNPNLNFVPAVLSAGPNKKYLDNAGDPNNPFATESDNIFGFRLRREGSKGN